MFRKSSTPNPAERSGHGRRTSAFVGACRAAAIAASTIGLTACQTSTTPAPTPVASVEPVPEPGWRASASADDLARIDAMAAAWASALQAARRRFSSQVEGEGELLDPDSALAFPAPTPGNYMCRWIRLGSSEAGARAFIAYRSFFCFIGAEGELLSLTKQTGSDRPSGYLFEDNSKRMIFLGSLAMGDEAAPRAYGEDPTRDLAGAFERIGSFRFRLVIPRPRSGALLEVIELTPAPVQND
jgi:hypothetical protein